VMSSSSRAGTGLPAGRLAPLRKPIKVHNPKITKQFLVVVRSAIVYQSIGFSHSLALHLTAYSLHCTPASGSR
jgi:hypothetical protein